MDSPFLHLRGLDSLPSRLRGASAAIGNFDGAHRGHAKALRAALEAARANPPTPALVVTFEPHPREFFNPRRPVFRLSDAREKAEIFEAMGFDAMIELAFDEALASTSAGDFVERVLVEGLGLSHVAAGGDFHFGKGREGTPQFMRRRAAESGFGVSLAPLLRDESGEAISSTRIRDALEGGDPERAARLLARRWRVKAEVIEGRRLGASLGYPTANMRLSPSARLAHGVYAARMRRADGAMHDGVSSFGVRPTVEAEGEPLLETFLFDFDGDLYGESCAVSLFSFLRGEEKFDSLDAMAAAMNRDAERARAILERAEPLSPLDAAFSFAAS